MKTQFFTGKGDSGESHYGKTTLKKSSLGADFLGSLDELNSWLGLTKVSAEGGSASGGEAIDVASVLKEAQNSIFIIQAEIASLVFGLAGDKKISEEKTKNMEDVIQKIDELVPPLTKFILPGGSELSARLDVGRTLARKAERLAKKFSEEKELTSELLQYLNRLSSLLFALARYVNHSRGIREDNPSY